MLAGAALLYFGALAAAGLRLRSLSRADCWSSRKRLA
jgi:hypothetical protein